MAKFFLSIYASKKNFLDFRDWLSLIAAHGSLMNWLQQRRSTKKNLAITLIVTFYFLEIFTFNMPFFQKSIPETINNILS